MLSSLNSYGGLSAANLLMLFGANSASSPSSSATSTSTTQSASPSISASDANDPAAAIKAILAQSEIVAGQGSANIVTVAAAYAAQTDGSSVVTGASATISSPDAASEVNDGIESGSSLAVGTANGVMSFTTANGTQAATDLSADALNAYQVFSTRAQQLEAESSVPIPTTNAPIASASDGTGDSGGNPQAGQSVLQLSIVVMNPGAAPVGPNLNAASYLNTEVETKAQQLVSAFQNNTLSPTSAQATGFSYIETDGAGTSISITGIEVSASDTVTVPGQLTQESGTTIPSFLASVNESFFSGNRSGLELIVPLGSS